MEFTEKLSGYNIRFAVNWCLVLFVLQSVFCKTSKDHKRDVNSLGLGPFDSKSIASLAKGNDWSDFQIKPAILTRSSEKKLPHFDTSTDQQVVTSPGVTAYLHCRVRNLGSKVVSWIRQKDMHILTVGVFRYTSYGYFTPLHKEGTDDWTLQISQPTSSDEGLYECQVSSSPKISRFIKLVVRDDDGPPKSQLQRSSSQAITSKGRRWKNDPYEDEPERNTVIPVAPDVYVRKGETASVTCYVLNSKPPPDYIKWYHKDKELIYGPRFPRIRIDMRQGGVNTTSSLQVHRFTKDDGGRYMCLPSNSYEAYVSIHVVEENASAIIRTPRSGALKSSTMANLSVLLATSVLNFISAIISVYPNG